MRAWWGGGVVAGTVTAAVGAALFGPGVVRPATPEVASVGPPAQAGSAAALLQGLAGTPPVACELALRSLGNRWGASSISPRVHPPLAPTASERAVAAWAWSDRPTSDDAPALLEGLASGDPCVRRVAGRLLGDVVDPGTADRVVGLARSASGPARLAAIASLAHLEAPAAPRALDALLDDPDADVRLAAAWALAGAGDRTSIPRLAAALRDGDTPLRENAAWALGSIEIVDAVAPLQAALGDPEPGVRVNAAWALGQIEDPAAIPSLASLLTSDAEDRVRRAAAWALGRIER